MSAFLAEYYLWIKALHLVAVIAWMAGMMYLPRLFIYHLESETGGEAEQRFVVMERRLLKGIMNPAIGAVWILGIAMLVANAATLSAGWFHVKLALVIAISGAHGFYASTQRKFEAGERVRTTKFWRILNEAPFVGLIIIVFMATLKPF